LDENAIPIRFDYLDENIIVPLFTYWMKMSYSHSLHLLDENVIAALFAYWMKIS
jgi:MarR-like DNA-binding transcriptional regulator SgrR of sgrS sRNA